MSYKGAAASIVGCLLAASPALAIEQVTNPGEYGCSKITALVSTPPGGSQDRMTRVVAPYLSEAFGMPVIVENQAGGRGVLAYTKQLAATDGCTISTVTVDNLVSHILEGNVSFDLDAWDIFNVQWRDKALLMASMQSSVKTFDDLVEGIKSPGKLAMAAGFGTAMHYFYLDMLDKLELDPAGVRNLSFGSGGEMRQSLMGGHTDFTIAPVALWQDISDYARPIALFSDEPIDGVDAPLINDALSKYNVSVAISSGMRGWLVPSTLKEKHPERYAILLKVMEAAMSDPELMEKLKASNIGHEWNGPEESNALVAQLMATIEPFAKK